MMLMPFDRCLTKSEKPRQTENSKALRDGMNIYSFFGFLHSITM